MRYKQIIHILLIGIGLMFAARADTSEDSIEVTASVGNDTVNIGDRILLNVIAEEPKGYEIRFPEVLEKTGDFTFLGSEPLPRKWNQGARKGRTYKFTIYDTGTHVIPPVPVEYRVSGDETWLTKESPQVPIEVKTLLTKDSKTIKPLKDILPYRSIFWKIIIISLVVLGLVISAGIIWYRRRTSLTEEEKKQAVPPHIIAYEELSRLRAMNLPEKGLVKEYYTRLSDILRKYLEGRFLLRAPEMTTEEFMERARASSQLGDKHKESLENFLSHSDMVKFAKYGPTKLEMLDSFKLAEEFVEETAREEKEEEA